ncbi:hypothetical protein B296_00041379 [Ensete ventricosum]|uniref:Uncharacterized protein n=1 Tax=Ensete ventricosum TaxID=4639 RepID=A0A426Z9B2_ENSVE|nr:hypothetical protein B296_00041379 [Ensete ventricosum]
MVNNSVLTLSANETKLVKILWGVLSASKRVKDANEAWLAEACLSPTPWGMFFSFGYYVEFFLIVPCRVEMFNLRKMKSDDGTDSGSTVPSTTSASATVGVAGSTTKKHPSAREEAVPKAVATYKVPRGFESGLEEMGRVNYEFGYRVVLERLRGKHLEIAIEQDPFAECLEDTNVEMDLNQPFDDSIPSEK